MTSPMLPGIPGVTGPPTQASYTLTFRSGPSRGSWTCPAFKDLASFNFASNEVNEAAIRLHLLCFCGTRCFRPSYRRR